MLRYLTSFIYINEAPCERQKELKSILIKQINNSKLKLNKIEIGERIFYLKLLCNKQIRNPNIILKDTVVPINFSENKKNSYSTKDISTKYTPLKGKKKVKRRTNVRGPKKKKVSFPAITLVEELKEYQKKKGAKII